MHAPVEPYTGEDEFDDDGDDEYFYEEPFYEPVHQGFSIE